MVTDLAVIAEPAEDPVAEFLNEECRDALRKIKGKEAAKKRATVLLLAIAEATSTAMSKVFKDPRACSEGIWYTKWQYDTAIKAALEVLTARALEWRDWYTARIEAQAAQERSRAIALGSLDAVQGLREIALSPEIPAKDRIEADMLLLALADARAAERIVLLRKGQPITVEIEGLDAYIEHELARVAPGSETGLVIALAGDAELSANR